MSAPSVPYEGTFRDRIAVNKRNSLLLIAAFLAFITIFGYIIGYAWLGNPAEAIFGLVLALVVGTISGLATYYGGDRMVLAASHAREVRHDEAPVLFNVVEEMSIAAGLPEKLNRDELQGVIAHEMSHVGNFDIRYAMLVGILVGTTVLISDFFLRGLWFGGGRRREGGGGQAQLIMMAIAIVLAILAPIFARLLQLSISRQREYLADASAVQLTRNPKALADALQKISGDQEVLEVANRATAHLYIVNPIKKFEKRAKGIFSTHPPIEERIRILRSMETGGIPGATG